MKKWILKESDKLNHKILLYDKMPKVTKCPSMIKCSKSKWHFAQVWQNTQSDKIPKRYYAEDDNMPKKSFCPRWQIIIKEISPMPKLTKCVQFSQFWPIFKFRPITIFFVIKKPIILLKFVREYECQILGLKKPARYLGKFSP